MELRQVFERLLDRYGPQSWWPGQTPFEVMVGAILTQNTAWTNVEKAIANLKANEVLTPEGILSADVSRLAEWVKSSGCFNIKAQRLRDYCSWYLQQGGFEALAKQETGDLRRGLLSVRGLGPETADDILLYAFERPVFVIDAYTRRLFSRLKLLEGNAGYETLRHAFETALGAHPGNVALFNEYHALIVIHAKEHCRKRPLCARCCLAEDCTYS